MTDAFLVIDGFQGTPPDRDDAGLPDAPAYYAAFPQEPSPFDMLTIDKTKTTVMTSNRSLFAVLAELVKAGSGGTALLICHAFRSGLLLPVAQGGNTIFADTITMDTIDSLIDDEAKHDGIRAMPRTTDKERQAVLDAWTAFINTLPGAHIDGQFTDAEAEKQYQQWFDQQAKTMELRSAANLRELLRRVKALRAAKLDRIELRACNIGSDSKTMARVRKFFGCNKLTAPKVGTFYGNCTVGPLGIGLRPRDLHLPTPTLPPGPTGHDDFREAADSTDLMLHKDTTRGFLPFSRVVPGAEVQIPDSPLFQLPRLVSGFRFVLHIEEISGRPFHFRPAAWAAGSAKAPAPDPDIIRQFCVQAIKADTAFNARTLPHAGLWTPKLAAKPFVLPLESEYLPLIAKDP